MDPGPNPESLEIRLNIGYFKTPSGIVKLVQLILGIICMACAAPATGVGFNGGGNFQIGTYGIGHNHWFLFVVVSCFLISLLWTFFYLLQVRDFIRVKLPFKFLVVELIFTLVATFLSFITILAGFSYCSTSQMTPGSHFCDARVAAGVFGFFNTITYGVGSYFVYSELRSTPPELQ